RKGGLTNDEKIVYGYIKGEGNKGIWIKDIKRRSNLHQDAVNDAIKNMEKKGVIKCVKSIKNPTRKIYMLFNTVPSEEITGGAWYTDNDIDVTFINELAKIVMNFIEKKSFPSDGKEQNLLYSAGYQGYATTRDVANYLRQNKIVTVDLSMGEIQTIIDMLRFEGKIQRILKVGDSRLGQAWMYQAIRAVGSKGNSLTDVPCGTCPVVDFCKPGGPVNPDNCVYYNKWLEF
ncbi:RNA polymerase Rpc34, partial [Zopfochytrium polystomum]